MIITVYSSKTYDVDYLQRSNHAQGQPHELIFVPFRLNAMTCEVARGSQAVCVFVNDCVDAEVLNKLSSVGVRLIVLRSAGYNHVDLAAAAKQQLTVVRVPAYSPYAVAEHTVGLMLCLNRKLHRAYNRVRDNNFALDGLLGFDFHGRSVGIIGTGKIGACVASILRGFGCRLLAHDVNENPDCLNLGVEYVSLAELFSQADIVTLHCPLTPQTKHLIDAESLAQMKPDAMLINTSRGALIDTSAVVAALKFRRLGSLGIDVYEEEADLFFEDLSGQVIQDDVFSRLLTFPNVLITGHQAFLTDEALTAIAAASLHNATEFEQTGHCQNEVTLESITPR